MGNVQWPIYLCLVAVWILCYFCIWKGVRWTAKIVYFTATAPIIMIIIMIVRGATLDGATNGITFYLRPEVHKLANVKVWMAAASQVIFSYGICFGAIVNLGSYNKIKHNLLRDSLFMLVVNSGASFMSGFAVFSVLGFMAKAQNTTVEAVAESGPGLVFLVYPHALSLLPLPQLWCALFFLTLILLGFDSQVSWTSSVLDYFPRIQSFRFGKELFIASVSFIFCVVGITMTTEIIVICNVYFYAPAMYNKVYVYPPWAQGLGLLIACSSIIWIPTIAIYDLMTATGTFQSRLKSACRLPGYVSGNLNINLKSESEISKSGVNVASNELKELI
ncbi:sodium- and chloride-dependent taurine transporter-like [Ciona intestinalis]